MKKKYVNFYSCSIKKIVFFFFIFSNVLWAQQSVYSRSDSNTNLWWDGDRLPWRYTSWNSNERRPDIWPEGTRNDVFIGHNNNTSMTVNGAFFQLKKLTLQSTATSNRTYDSFQGGAISLSEGYYKETGSGDQTFNVQIGIDGTSVDFSVGDRTTTFTNNFFLNSNTAKFDGAGNIIINGVAQGSGGQILKQGSGLLILSGANTYTGATIVNAGTLQLNRVGGNTIPTTNTITVNSGATLRISSNQTLNNLTVSSGGNVIIDPQVVLKVNGTFTNNGQIIFKSDATGSAMFDQFSGSILGNGTVTVERFIPANKRSFRFLTSAVTTSTSIKANWQENVSNTTTVYADNQNPNSGYGTHITGTGGSANGFDTTTTNNPSMYAYTNGAWAALQNTNSNFTAGTPYRLLVRGDRSIDMSTNTPTPTNTILRATGTLHTGNFTPALNQAASGYSFVGNPYQAPIDIKAALDASTNMDKTIVYYWDPTLNTRGAYVTRTLSSDSNNVPSSFNQYLQPGQAVFVQNTSAGAPTMTITESHKAVGNAAAGVFRTTDSSDFGLLRVHLQANTNNQWNTIEGTLAVFNNMYSWNTTEEDAVKFANLDEEVSLMQDNTSLAIAMQTNPSSTNELPIRLKNTRHTAYQWKFELSDYNGLTPYLVDTQNNTYTPIENNTVVPFTVNGQELNRFKIVFQNSALSIDDFANNIKLYPNPAKAGASFYIDGMAEATVSVYNVLGQNIPVQLKSQGNAIQVTPTQTLSQGIYLVTVTTEGKTQHVKWIVE
jgi:autotransporter-associated beta strand protein